MRNPMATRSTRALARAYLIAVLAFLFAPLVVVVLFESALEKLAGIASRHGSRPGPDGAR